MGRSRGRFILVAAVLVANTGCFASKRVNRVMASWVGHHYSALLMTWGPPQGVYEDGAGGRLLVWLADRSITTPGQAVTRASAQATLYDGYIWGQAQSVTEFRPPSTYGYTAWRMFRIDSEGIVRSWSWRGL